MDILLIIVGIIGFAFSIMVHEIAHGLVADKLGDPTARLMGRITLNPIPHIDPIGSIIVPLILYLSHSPFLFGWAKPVSVDPFNLKDPRKDMSLISLAGPLSNIALAIIFSVILRILITLSPNSAIFTLFFYLIAINITIAIFNLIPIKILDGGSVLSGILPHKEAIKYDKIMNKLSYIPFLLLILPIFGGESLASIIISPIINFLLSILVPRFSFI